jgi:hypothetical protein
MDLFLFRFVLFYYDFQQIAFLLNILVYDRVFNIYIAIIKILIILDSIQLNLTLIKHVVVFKDKRTKAI